MTPWWTWTLLYIALAAAIGALCSFIPNRRAGVIASGAVPWVLSLVWFGFREFYWPYEGSGVFIWLVVQLIWGTFALVAGFIAYTVARRWARKGNIGAF
jgi:TM2 domain-containing membrane protein YozV